MPARRGTRKAAAPVEEPQEEFEELGEEVEDEEEFEELEDDEVEDEVEEPEEEEAPAPRRRGRPAKAAATAKKAPAKKAAAAKVEKASSGYDTGWLAEYVTAQTGIEYDGRAVRMLLRKLANTGKLDRNVGEDRGRYEFTGPNDPAVKAVIAMVKSGEAAADKTDRIEKAKATKATATRKERGTDTRDPVQKATATKSAAAKPATTRRRRTTAS